MRQTGYDTRELRRMIDFATRWMPYGGGRAEDITVDFGISPGEFFARLQKALDDPASPIELDPDTVGALLEVCRRRLWLDE